MIVYLITALVLVIYLVLVAVFSPETGKWTFRIIFWLLGLAGAGLFLWFYRRRNRPAQLGSGSSLSADVVSLFRQAEDRLAQTRLGKKAKIGRLPLLIVIGEAGAAKTSAIVNSRTEPLHLAGQLYEENRIVSTPVVNLWLAGEIVIAEAGPAVLEDPDAWSAFLRAVRPARLPALVSGREAPRSVVVCVNGEGFLSQGAQDAVQSSARNLRTRVNELAQRLGINLPVYVLFNKLDRVPSFLDFARNVTEAEAGQHLGAAVAARDPRQAGVYSEQESRRLSQAFDGVFHRLAGQRLELLAREQTEEKLAGIYEFPRDLAKLRSSMVGFLVELLKPAQLTAEPFLRGFYFSGVRPVVVGEEARRRRVPQWMHLPHLFSDVLLRDLTQQQGAASVGTRFGRRLMWVGASAVALLFLILATVSFFGNRHLVSQAVEAAEQTTVPARDPNGLPNAESLASLERLRLSLSEIVAYRRDGRPLRLRWGLYIGDYIYPTLFRLYFDRFQRTLFSETHASLLNWLRKLPPRPGPEGEFQPAYERLKGYLCTTEIPHCARRAFLSPVLMETWLAGREIDEDRLALAQAQFDFYGDVLPVENPYSLESDGATVRHAQNYLSQFGGFDRLYLQLLATAAGDRKPIRFNELFPQAAKVVVNKKEVHPAYTRDGWALAAQGLEGLGGATEADACDSHVLGPAAGSMEASADLRDRLLARYSEEYKKQWLEFLKATRILGYGSPRDAAAKLETLAAVPNSSPLLALIWLASEHTSGGPPDVVEFFQPVQHVVPPGQEGVYLSDDNREYMANLLRLQNAWAAVAEDPRGAKNQAAVGGVRSAADTATDAANVLAQGFTGDLSVATEVRKTLLAPIRTSQQYLVRLTTPSGDDLCRSLSVLKRKYPFNPKATQEATVTDIEAVFHPELGALKALFDNLAGAMVFDESRRVYAARQGAELNLSPRFVAFFNDMARISQALYPGAASQIQFGYIIAPYPNQVLERMELHVDGQVLRSGSSGGRPVEFAWPGQGSGVQLRIFPGGFEPQRHEGLWAVTRFFAQNSGYDRASGTYEWRPETAGQPMILNGRQVVIRYRVTYPSGVPFLQQGYLSGLACVSKVTR